MATRPVTRRPPTWTSQWPLTDRPDDSADAAGAGAAAELAQEPSGLEGGHGLLCCGANLGVRGVDSLLSCGELVPAAAVGTLTMPSAPQ